MKDLLRTPRNLFIRYGVALFLACLALLIRGLIPIGPGIAIYQLALAAVIVSAWYAGRGPALLATAISAAGILYWFIPPRDSFALPAEYALSLTLFFANCALLIEFSMGRRRAEHDLEQSEGRFRLMAATVPEVLWIESLDPPKMLYLSPSYDRIWGRPAEDIYRNHALLLDAIHPEDRSDVNSALKRWRAGEDEDRYDVEYRIVRPDGDTRWIHARGTLIRDEKGKAYRASGIAEDITETKLSQQALNQAQAELAQVSRVTTLGTMTASIAHELNQPLTAVVNHANACLRWLAANKLEAARQSAERIVSDGDRAGKIISGIRALVNKAPPKKDWLDISETILEVIALTRGEVQKNRVSLETRFSTDLPLILGDRIQLQQVILNLINNAIEAMSAVDDGPRKLQVASTIGESQNVVVEVRDSGPGLDQANLDGLFHAFYTTKPKGMGLGLAISRSIIEAHGGQLWATANEERGATFKFSLPTGRERT